MFEPSAQPAASSSVERSQPSLMQRTLHELRKVVVGQTPHGDHQPQGPEPSSSSSSRPPPSSRSTEQPAQFDEEANETRKRTARYGGDDPKDPEDEKREVQERIRRQQAARRADSHTSEPSSGVTSNNSTVIGHSSSEADDIQGSSNDDQQERRQQAQGDPEKKRQSGADNETGSDVEDGGDNDDNNNDNDESEKTSPDPNEVGWNGPDDPENPQNWSTKSKWGYTILVSVLTVNVTYASSSPSTTTQQLSQEFHIGSVTATLITSLFLFGYCLGPILWSTASELYGRKVIFSSSMLVYTLFILGQALAQNAATLFITRFLSGVFASAPLTNSGGLIADIWDPVGRGFAMSVFSASVFIGPVMGPIIGGFVTQSYLGWRWVFWVMMIFAAAVWILTLLLLPETFAPVLLLRKAKRLRRIDPDRNKDLYAPHERTDWSLGGVVHRTLFRPFQILVQEPILVAITIYLSVVYGLLYALFEAVPVIFSDLRGFNLGQSGLVFIGVGVGTTIGAIIYVCTQLKYRALAPFWKGMPPPEERLIGSMIAGPLLVIGCFWLGWTGNYPSVPWYVPALSLVCIGMTFTLIFISQLAYVVEVYLMYAASALAANTIIRSAVGGGLPLVTRQFFTNVGVNWASSIIGFVGLALTPFPFLFYWYGSRIRGASKFAPAIDLRIRKELEAEGKLPKDSLNHWTQEALSGLPQAKEELKRRKQEQEAGGKAA